MKYAKIQEVRRTALPKPRLTVDGYTCRSGSPSEFLVRKPGENRWRRVYYWCFSNAATHFIRVSGTEEIVISGDLQDLADNLENKS